MRRIFLAMFFSGLVVSGGAFAQSSDGGFPWSTTEMRTTVGLRQIPVVTLPTPDYAKAQEEDKNPTSGAYRFGLTVPADIDLSQGKMIYLEDGRRIWTVKVEVEGALGTYFLYDRFYLPKGVSLFLKNENGRQIAGAYNERYNPDDGLYSTDLIQGTIATIELNIEEWVDVADIQLHIEKVVAAYRGGFAEALPKDYGDPDAFQLNAANRPLDNSDPCHVNAICYPEGQTYEKLRRTVAQVTMDGYVCSGNLINNTATDCKPLFLMASHCEGSNSFDNSTFGQWQFYFNDEYPGCSVNNVPRSSLRGDKIVGARFRARSPYNSGSNSMIGDFLLLELKDPQNRLGNNYNAYLAGWDRSSFTPQGDYIGFHHPAGDPKKLTVFKKMEPTGSFNNGAPGSHWKLSLLEKGGIQGGSSGSAIFSMATQRLYGDLSGGPNTGSPCDNPNISGEQNYSMYSKISLNWEYVNGGDGTSETRLMDWLDPAGTGKKTTNTIKVAASGQPCEDNVSVRELDTELEDALHVYPNPSTGIVYVQVNLERRKDIQVDIVNVLGAKVGVYSVKDAAAGHIKMDLSNYPNGIYLLKVSTKDGSATKKIVLNK